MTADQLFEDKLGVCHLHDAILDATGQSLSDEELRKAFDNLPEEVQNIAFEWGLSDTAFRDAI